MGNVMGDGRCPDDLALFIPYRRDGEGDFDDPPIFCPALRLQVVDVITGMDLLQDVGGFVTFSLWNEQ